MLRRVFQPLAVAAMLVIALNACSTMLSLDADCDEASDCGAYRCDDENVACLDSCTSHQECAGAFVCELGFGRCEGGYCQPLSPVVALDDAGEDFDVVASALVVPEGHERQLVVVTGQAEGVSLQRYHLPSFRRYSDPVDEELGGLRLDFPLASPLPLVGASEDAANGVVRFAWANANELRTARLDSTAPWLYATETTFNAPEDATMQAFVAHGAHRSTQLAWEETCGESCTRPFSQHMRPDGSFTLARPLWMEGAQPSVISDDDRVDVLWLTHILPNPEDSGAEDASRGTIDDPATDEERFAPPSTVKPIDPPQEKATLSPNDARYGSRATAPNGRRETHPAAAGRPDDTQWAILRRTRAPDALYDLREPPIIVYQGEGAPPEAVFAARGDASILLFTRHTNALGRVDDELRVIGDDGALRENISYTDGFSRIDELRVVPATGIGAWVGVIGTWQGEHGVWARFVDGLGVVDRYPVRVTDAPPTGTIEMLQLSHIGGHLNVTWAAREHAAAPRRGYSRLFACE